MKIKPPAGKALAAPANFAIEAHFRRDFTWLQRLQIAIGYSVNIKVIIACQHSPGSYSPLADLTTTKEPKGGRT